MTNIVPFYFERVEVRTLMRHCKPRFVLADVCRVLEINNPSDAAKRLDSDEKHTLDTIEGGNLNGLGTVGSEPRIISESGLYSLVLTSRKAAAKRFRKWVTAEVLPAIRKTGAYIAPGVECSAADREVIGGIVKAVTTKVNAEMAAKIESLIADIRGYVMAPLAGYDPTQSVVVNYFPMKEIFIAQGVVNGRSRRGLSTRCSRLMNRWCIKKKYHSSVQICKISDRHIFHVDAIREWLDVEGRPIIKAHMDRITGQCVLKLVPKTAPKAQSESSPSN